MSDQPVAVLCANCGKSAARLRRVSRSFGQGETLLVVENIPIFACTDCGESFMTPETLDALGRIRRERATSAVVRPVAVAGFTE